MHVRGTGIEVDLQGGGGGWCDQRKRALNWSKVTQYPVAASGRAAALLVSSCTRLCTKRRHLKEHNNKCEN